MVRRKIAIKIGHGTNVIATNFVLGQLITVIAWEFIGCSYTIKGDSLNE